MQEEEGRGVVSNWLNHLKKQVCWLAKDDWYAACYSPNRTQGKKVNKVLIAQDVYYKGEAEIKEFYISILLKQKHRRNMS